MSMYGWREGWTASAEGVTKIDAICCRPKPIWASPA
jgi:hypothetical protein